MRTEDEMDTLTWFHLVLLLYKMSQFLPQLYYVLDCDWIYARYFHMDLQFVFTIHNFPPKQLLYKLCQFIWSYIFSYFNKTLWYLVSRM